MQVGQSNGDFGVLPQKMHNTVDAIFCFLLPFNNWCDTFIIYHFQFHQEKVFDASSHI